MEDIFKQYKLNPLVTKNILKKFGFHYDYRNNHYVYTESLYKDIITLQVSIDEEQSWISYTVMDNDHECIYAPYYNTEFGKNKLINKFDKNIKKILKRMENNKIITNVEDDENEDCEIW